MASKYQAPRGTFDVLPEAALTRARIEAEAEAIFDRAGYQRIATPAFEDTELFERGVGRSTDIVRKEMFTFEDKGGRSITLRPEGTAPICRAYVEHGMHKLAQPVKLFYSGPFFRHERPQAGRYRQFHQIGIEALGSDSPAADAEAIVMLHTLLTILGVPGVKLRLSSLGSLDTRTAYLEDLKSHLYAHEAELSKEVRERIEINPLRAFDSDDESTRKVMEGAPKLLDRLEGDDERHFEALRAYLGVSGVEYEVAEDLVRGLDYYTRTIFSFVCEGFGAQSEVGGGGRYDGLIEQLGGPSTPAVGWAVGIERIMLALGEDTERARRDAFVAFAGEKPPEDVVKLVGELRDGDLSAELDLGGRSLKGQLKHADRLRARVVLTVEPDGAVQLWNTSSGDRRQIDRGDAVEEVRRAKSQEEEGGEG